MKDRIAALRFCLTGSLADGMLWQKRKESHRSYY